VSQTSAGKGKVNSVIGFITQEGAIGVKRRKERGGLQFSFNSL
jgi:hypothetical protein